MLAAIRKADPKAPAAWLATKVWTRGKREGIAQSWAQLLLKFIVGHPAVTCPIPATSKIAHVEDNLGALRGPVPTEAQRRQILAALG